MPTDGDGFSVFGGKFKADVDFNKAIRDADTLDRQLDRIARNVNYLGTVGKGQIDAFAASLARAAGAAGGLLSATGTRMLGTGQGMAFAALSGGGGSFGPYSRLGGSPIMALPGAFVPQAQAYNMAPSSLGAVPPTISSGGMVNLTGGFNRVLPSQLGGGTLGSNIIDVPYRVLGSGSAGGGGGSIVPYYQPPQGPTNFPLFTPFTGYTASRFAGTPLGPGAFPHATAWFTAPGNNGFNMGGLNNFSSRQIGGGFTLQSGGGGFFGPLGAGAMLQSGLTGPIAGGAAGTAGMLGRTFNYQNVMRAAGALYIGQNLANMATFAGRQTIGQAMFLEERQALLENALMSPTLGIDRAMAETRAASLTGASYFAGMPVTAQEMGLSRPELAEQFRQLAPIIRLTAGNQDEFQTGLQTGALARALLVARDPVQGTRGAAVALSELYSGGPDRFRSLALRFELPRNRLMEIEKEMGGADNSDPGQVVIQMLREMGFGPDYLVRRAGTLAGQLGRSGALADNFRTDLYEGSMNKVRDNLTGLNDAFEAFLDSDAGEKAIGLLDNLFGRITGFLTDQPMNMLTSMMRGEGAIDSDRLASNIVDYMQVRGGSYIGQSGRATDPATAFREAATLLTNKGLEQALRAPTPNAMSNLGFQGGLLTLGGIAVTGVADKVLTGGLLRQASQQLLTGGAAVTATKGALAGIGGAIPMAALAGLGFTTAMGLQSNNMARDWRTFALANPDLAAEVGVDPRISGLRMWADRAMTWQTRITRGNAGLVRAFGDSDPFTSDFESAGLGLATGDIALRLRQKAALLSLGQDPTMVQTQLVGDLTEFVAANPGSKWADLSQFGSLIEDAMGFAYSPSGGTSVGETVTKVVLGEAAKRNAALVGNGRTYAPDPAAMLANGGAAGLWSTLLGDSGGDQDKALLLLAEMARALTGIEVNTSALTGDNAFSYIRASGAGDIFTSYNADPDMRFARRSGAAIPIGTAAGRAAASGASLTISRGSSASTGTQRVALSEAANALGYNEYFGGRMNLDNLYHADRGTHLHGGIDYTDKDGNIPAPYAGTVEYLFSQEDFARYADLYPGGYKTYGNMALFRDPLGLSITTFSHLSDETRAVYGGLTNVGPGQTIGLQGSTGDSTGPHVHRELLLNDGAGSYDRANPLLSEDLYTNVIPNIERTANAGGSVNVEVEGITLNLSPAQTAEEMTDAVLADPTLRERLLEAITRGLEAGGNALRVLNAGERRRQREGTAP